MFSRQAAISWISEKTDLLEEFTSSIFRYPYTICISFTYYSVNAFKFAWIADKIPVARSWAESSWLLKILYDLMLLVDFPLPEVDSHQSPPLPHLSWLPNIDFYFLPLPSSISPFSYHRSLSPPMPSAPPRLWLLNLPIGSGIILPLCRRTWSWHQFI